MIVQMIFTVYCAALLFIQANGGGTHVTSVPQLQLLTKVSTISVLGSASLNRAVGSHQ